ncbi:Bug family tripartite tricarboxylate transporter substrate binding protein [Roseicella aquatilis]|uniref:Tripartite tricarboxylate transporter substrate binding protein n=1 Tax=Roseicella aquatilis TaxID=2527868 RepID=A0A4R4DW11_9PROT|nr:tripartite tricarboxylate transporter substrate binding protein [Roseicella aquatilis]TCZ66548.1 tripartite tricarboxylate transporter substrate binding protein [Roseicella aquatilis]
MTVFQPRRRALLGATAALATTPLLPRQAPAQGGWPDRPIRFLVGFSPGGLTDTTARLAAPGYSEALGQPVAIENRTGAAGNIATETVVRAAPDGLTLLVANVGQIVINPHTYDRLAFDPMRDLVPVALMTMTGLLQVVHPSLGVSSHAELVARLKREPGMHKFATSGAGGIAHVVQELWARRVGVEMTPVHYRGAAAMTPELLRGEPRIGLDTVIQFEQHIRSGALRGTVNVAARRSPMLPQIPVSAEVGLDGFLFDNWFGLFAPRGTPQAVIDRLVEANRRALAPAQVVERLAAGAVEAVPGTPAELQARCEREYRLYGEAIRASGISAAS